MNWKIISIVLMCALLLSIALNVVARLEVKKQKGMVDVCLEKGNKLYSEYSELHKQFDVCLVSWKKTIDSCPW